MKMNMKVVNKSVLSLALVSAVSASGQALAGFEGNIGVASNYVWRGMTQTQDQAAVSGGLDYSSDAGFYVGTWASNVDFGSSADPVTGDITTSKGYELDLYGGYGGEIGGFGYDIGYIYYAYPVNDDADFSEVYLNGSVAGFDLGVAYQVDADFTDENYIYYHAGYSFDLAEDWGLGLTVGSYDYGEDGDDVTHYGVSVSKGDFGFAVDKNDIDGDDDPRVTVSWSKSF